MKSSPIFFFLWCYTSYEWHIVHELITWFSATSSWVLALDCSLLFWRRDWTSDSTCKWSVNLNFSFNKVHCSSRRSFSRLNSWHVRSNLATVRSLNSRSSFSYSQIYLNFWKSLNYMWLRYLLDASTSKFLLRVWVDVHVPVFPSWCAVVVGLDQYFVDVEWSPNGTNFLLTKCILD